MANSVVSRKGLRKLNPINVKDQETKNNFELVSGNLATLFGLVNAQRSFISKTISLNSYSNYPDVVSPAELSVVATVSGTSPVIVGLVPAGIEAFNISGGGFTAGGFHIFTTTVGAIGTASQFYLLADGVSFWGTVKGIYGPVLGVGEQYHYYGSPSEILGVHYPGNPGQVKYSLSIHNVIDLQATEIIKMALFAIELF